MSQAGRANQAAIPADSLLTTCPPVVKTGARNDRASVYQKVTGAATSYPELRIQAPSGTYRDAAVCGSRVLAGRIQNGCDHRFSAGPLDYRDSISRCKSGQMCKGVYLAPVRRVLRSNLQGRARLRLLQPFPTLPVSKICADSVFFSFQFVTIMCKLISVRLFNVRCAIRRFQIQFIDSLFRVECNCLLELFDCLGWVVQFERNPSQLIVDFGRLGIQLNGNLEAIASLCGISDAFLNQSHQIVISPFGGSKRNSSSHALKRRFILPGIVVETCQAIEDLVVLRI